LKGLKFTAFSEGEVHGGAAAADFEWPMIVGL
jgi:hypothetical protein